MIKSNDIIGKPVLSKDLHKRLEIIQDIIFDTENKRILGFVVDEGGWFKDAKIVLWEGIEQIDDMGVTLLSEKYIIPAGYAPPIEEMMEQGNILHQAKVITTDGDEVGRVVDIYFNRTTGQVGAFDVVEPDNARSAGNDPIFVPISIVTEINRETVVINAAVADVLDWVSA